MKSPFPTNFQPIASLNVRDTKNRRSSILRPRHLSPCTQQTSTSMPAKSSSLSRIAKGCLVHLLLLRRICFIGYWSWSWILPAAHRVGNGWVKLFSFGARLFAGDDATTIQCKRRRRTVSRATYPSTQQSIF